jgi:hypothetical protein
MKYRVWNVDRARPVGGIINAYRQALRLAHAAELNSGEHYTVVPA